MNQKPFHGILRRGTLLLCGTLSLLPLAAQTNAPQTKAAPTQASPTNAPRNFSSRYLILVDTSSAMRRRAPAVEVAIGNLLRSSMAAQLQRGDTVGVWTFNEALTAGRFPLQLWTPERSSIVTSNVVAFLKAQRYEKQSRFEVVVPMLDRIVRDSHRLTIILVSDGDEKISGTPFDAWLARSFAEKFKAQEKARMPFITVLRSVRGQFKNAAVSLAPWPVEFPDFPPEPVIVETPKPKPVEKPPEPKPVVPPLIVIGRKPEPPPITNAPAATNETVVVPAPPETNAPPRIQPVAPPITPTPPQLSPVDLKPSPAPAEAAGPATNPPAPPVVPLPVVVPQPATSAPPAVVATRPTPPPIITPPAESVAVPTSNAPVVTAPVTPPPETPNPVAPGPTTNEVVPTSPPAPVALAVQPEPAFSRMGMIAIGIAILLLAGGLFLVLHRRARHRGEASLITRSLDQDRK